MVKQSQIMQHQGEEAVLIVTVPHQATLVVMRIVYSVLVVFVGIQTHKLVPVDVTGVLQHAEMVTMQAAAQ